MANRLELWKSQERIKEVGWKQWYTEMIEHYSCPECGVLNSAADMSCRNCGATPSCRYVKIHEDEINQLRVKIKTKIEAKTGKIEPNVNATTIIRHL